MFHEERTQWLYNWLYLDALKRRTIKPEPAQSPPDSRYALGEASDRPVGQNTPKQAESAQ